MILFIFSIVVSLIIVVFHLYNKLKYRFWSIQPIKHSYNIFHNLGNNSYVIQKELPKINRYTNIVDIKTKSLDKYTDNERKEIISFIKKYYLQTDNFHYSPQQDNIFPYLDFSNHKGFISIYYRPTYIIENNAVKNDNEYIGIITARVLYINFNNIKMVPAYYTEHLSIKPEYRDKNKGINGDFIPKLLQTHIYHIRHANHKISVGLLKFYNKPHIIKPLTTVYISGFQIKTLTLRNMPHPKFNLIEISNSHSTLLNDFLTRQQKHYKCVIMPQLSNLLALIKSQNLLIYGILYNNKLVALYVFKNIFTYYGKKNSAQEETTKEPNTLLSIASMNEDRYRELLVWGFLMSVNRCSRMLKTTYIFIETTSKNKRIMDILHQTNKRVSRQRADFVLYNYNSPTYQPENCLFIY